MPGIVMQGLQAGLDKTMNEKFGKLGAYGFRMSFCLAANIAICISAPFIPDSLMVVFIIVVLLCGVVSSAAYGALFQLVTLFPSSTTTFLSFGYSFPGLLLPFIAIGIFGDGAEREITPHLVQTFFFISAAVVAMGLACFWILVCVSKELLNEGMEKLANLEAAAERENDGYYGSHPELSGMHEDPKELLPPSAELFLEQDILDKSMMLAASDVPISLDMKSMRNITVTVTADGQSLLSQIWPCGVGLLVCNLSRLLVINLLPHIPTAAKLVPDPSLTQTLIYIALGCDLGGRLLTLIPLPRTWSGMPPTLLMVALLQLLTVNLAFIYALQNPLSPWIPYDDTATKIFMGIFSVTTGFLITQCYLVAPVTVKSTSLKPQVGALMNVLGQVGNVTALVSSFVFSYTVFA